MFSKISLYCKRIFTLKIVIGDNLTHCGKKKYRFYSVARVTGFAKMCARIGSVWLFTLPFGFTLNRNDMACFLTPYLLKCLLCAFKESNQNATYNLRKKFLSLMKLKLCNEVKCEAEICVAFSLLFSIYRCFLQKVKIFFVSSLHIDITVYLCCHYIGVRLLCTV